MTVNLHIGGGGQDYFSYLSSIASRKDAIMFQILI